MTYAERGLLIEVSSVMFYQPKGNDAECLALAAKGMIQPITQGKLKGYCLAKSGMAWLRRYLGLEQCG